MVRSFLGEMSTRPRPSMPPALGCARAGTRVAPLDNFMIYKDIIRLDRPD